MTRDLEHPINGMTCSAYLPSGPVVMPERFVTVTYTQALTFLARIEAARASPGEMDEAHGTFDLSNAFGSVRFRCWSSSSHVEIELWQGVLKRTWIAEASSECAREVILACPALDAVFELLAGSACAFEERPTVAG
ncbi:MAG: hypothetical protein R3B13_16805 [Polyangiaceae bacterium]